MKVKVIAEEFIKEAKSKGNNIDVFIPISKDFFRTYINITGYLGDDYFNVTFRVPRRGKETIEVASTTENRVNVENIIDNIKKNNKSFFKKFW